MSSDFLPESSGSLRRSAPILITRHFLNYRPEKVYVQTPDTVVRGFGFTAGTAMPKINAETHAPHETTLMESVRKNEKRSSCVCRACSLNDVGRRDAEVDDSIAKALELHPQLGEAYATCGFTLALHKWDRCQTVLSNRFRNCPIDERS